MQKVTKFNLVDAIYQKTNCEKYVVQEIVEKFIEEVKLSLEEGATIELRGFGTFEPRLRKGRETAHNPKTGEVVSVAPHYVAAFRAGQELRKSLWDLKIEDSEEK